MITGILNADSGDIKINDISIKQKPLEAKNNLVLFQIVQICF